MVQRKVVSKLGIKADHIKPDSASGISQNPPIRTSPPQYPDHGKTGRGHHDLKKKKMKKSRSIKRSNIDSLRSLPFGTEVAQPGKPPPLGARVPNYAAPTPQKQPQVRPADGVPNYMKPTSSSDARKERISVSPPSTRTVSDNKRTRRMSSASSSTGSLPSSTGKTPVKHLKKRSSSSRLVRTLTKTPSFKPSRSSSGKRCSKVVLCANMDAQRATCSSTLKDSRFPKYLTLSPGATEAEGTSAMKVCPYTYCSLNGHRHAPLPPLKCFISSRRRAMKTQRSLKVEALKTDAEEPTLVNGPTSMEDGDGRDFFVQIYAETKHKDTYYWESSPEEEKESEDQEGVDPPVSISEAASSVESFQAKYGSEVECGGSEQEAGSEYSDMEWDGDRYSAFELDEAIEHSTEDESAPSTEKPEVCSDFLLIDWKIIPDEKVKGEDDEASTEDQHPEDQVTETSEPCQVVDCFNYDKHSSSEEDEPEEATADAEEVAESPTELPSAEQVESIEIDPLLHRPQESLDSSITSFSIKHTRELSTMESQCLCQEKEETAKDEESESIADERPKSETQDVLSDEQQSRIRNVNKSQNLEMSDEEKMKILAASEDSIVEADQEEAEIHTESIIAEKALLELQNQYSEKSKGKYTRAERNSKQDPDPSQNWIGKNICKRLSEEDPRRFNPRDPNYLPVVPDPEAEKVDLRHQMMDERRNSDEWMVDYALRQAVTRLAPARKRKVALLVEAFEKVMPIPKVTPISKWETHVTAHLTSPRPIQACS